MKTQVYTSVLNATKTLDEVEITLESILDDEDTRSILGDENTFSAAELDSFFLDECPFQCSQKDSLYTGDDSANIRGSFSSSIDDSDEDIDFASLDDITLESQACAMEQPLDMHAPMAPGLLARCESNLLLRCESIHAMPLDAMLLDFESDSDSCSVPSLSGGSSAAPSSMSPTSVAGVHASELELVWSQCDTTSPRCAPPASTSPAGVKRKRTPELDQHLDTFSPRQDAPAVPSELKYGTFRGQHESCDSTALALSTSIASDTTVPCLSVADKAREPSLMVRITQGVTERADQWLRSMDRLTFFNIDLDLGCYEHFAPHVANALAGCPTMGGVEVAMSCHLMYADTYEVVPFKHEASRREHVSLISTKGNTKEGVSVLESNGVHLSTASGHDSFQTSEYLSVKLHDALVQSAFKFSTNITSRRHGKRNNGRQFFWKISITVMGLTEEPISMGAQSHTFGYISRPAPASTSGGRAGCEGPVVSQAGCEGPVLSLIDVASDNRPGDMITIVGVNLQDDSVSAVIGSGDATLAELPRLRQSKHAFISRLPSVMAPGSYWIQLSNNISSTERMQMEIVENS